MSESGFGDLPITVTSLPSFFHSCLADAIRNQHVTVSESSQWYLARMLSEFSRSERFFEYREDHWVLTPLATIYGSALAATSENERQLILRRLGDVALFVAGIFSGFFERYRRAVDADYYISMGSSAYSCVDDARLDPEMFAELAAQFAALVNVLAEISERAYGSQSGKAAMRRWNCAARVIGPAH